MPKLVLPPFIAHNRSFSFSRAHGTGRLLLAWYMADVKGLDRVDPDHHGTDDGVAREPVYPS